MACFLSRFSLSSNPSIESFERNPVRLFACRRGKSLCQETEKASKQRIVEKALQLRYLIQSVGMYESPDWDCTHGEYGTTEAMSLLA